MTPDIAQAWIRVIRDLALVLLGVYILLYEVHREGDVRETLIGAALILFGLPAALRTDEWLRNGRSKNGNHRADP